MRDQTERPAPAGFPRTRRGDAAGGGLLDSYNAELRTPEGFLGDRPAAVPSRRCWTTGASASATAPRTTRWAGADKGIPRKQLDALLADGDSEAAGLVHGVVEEFAQSLATVVVGRC